MKKQVIAYLHSHWDREWYREFETFRMRLLRVFDNILDLLLKEKIPCFYFDGQVSALEDYLEIRPENKNLIKQLIRQKKLFIGPFYCLIDEFLTDKTCFEKNLELGMKYAGNLGCFDFIGYLPDTFGHSKNVLDILRDFGIDKCIVWRGCGDFPAEFSWCGMDTVNLVQGYFNDFFSLELPIQEKAKLLKKHLDKIAQKSSEFILLPIGADHLGIEIDIEEQINNINALIKDDYEIKLSSPFEYFKLVENTFKKFEWNDELRDNSRTFTLQGCYSSRLDIKRENIEATYLLDLATRFAKQQNTNNYNTLIDYAYKMLIRNQAHDSICGCSIDDVHKENLIRFKKIKQIANGIIDELKFKNYFDQKKIINLSNKTFSGITELTSTLQIEGYDIFDIKKGFDKYLLTNTQKIPVTEDIKDIKTYLVEITNLSPNNVEFIMPNATDSDLEVNNVSIKNQYISANIENKKLFINGLEFGLYDFKDLGDSYNFGPQKDDYGNEYTLSKSKIFKETPTKSTLKIDFEGKWDIITLFLSLCKKTPYIEFNFEWNNSRKNHLIEVGFKLAKDIHEVYSEDMNLLIKRTFDPNYDIRENLPKEKGFEARTNTAPMQRGLLIDEEYNNIGIITKGLTQYEVFQNKIYIPILRATGLISNPYNPARTTPAGPPIEVNDLQQIGTNNAEFYVFFGNQNDFYKTLDSIYNYIIT